MENAVLEQGRLIKVVEYRGEPKDRIVEVVRVRDTHKEPLTYRSYQRNAIERSRYLLTVFDVNKKEHRSYYHSFVKVVTLEPPVKRTTFLRRLWNFFFGG